jgi:excisionase family DNA binding protein
MNGNVKQNGRLRTGIGTRMNYTLSQAAKVTGKSKSSISRAIDTGRLSANRNGSLFEIDAAELHRVFPLKVDTDGVPLNGSKNVPRNDLDDRGTGRNYSILDREIELLRERLGDKETQITDLRGERDRLLKVLEEQAGSVRQLTDQSRKLTAEPPPQPKGFRGFLHRLTG